jgi:predicted O-methyltransferase YrrM
LEWSAPDEFCLDGVSYGCRVIDGRFASTPSRFCIRKPKPDVERFERLLADLQPSTVLELGIDEGGSTALIFQLAAPELLIALDIHPQANLGLERFIAERGLTERVRAHWGIDQADGERVHEIARSELDERALDLIIDDASHEVEPTRSSFEALFPLLRPGGTFLIEDWDWAHAALPMRPRATPLTALVFELVVAAAHAPDVISSVLIEPGWTRVRRGERTLGPGELSLRGLLGERALALLSDGRPRHAPRPGAIRRAFAAIFRRA